MIWSTSGERRSDFVDVLGLLRSGYMLGKRGRSIRSHGFARTLASLSRSRSVDAFMEAISGEQSTELIVHVEADGSSCQIETPLGERIAISEDTACRSL